MFTVIMRLEDGQVAKLHDGFETKGAATAHIKKFAKSYPDAFVIPTPTEEGEWEFGADNALTFITPVEVNPLHRDLSRAGFNWLLAYTGLDDVWAGLEAHFKTADRATYATLREAANRNTFRLATTLAMVESFKAFAPDVDLSEETITAAWELAANRDADK